MSPDSEEIQHESVDREKPLRVRSGFEQAHLSLALSRRLMRNLCAIVRVSVRAMGDGRHDRSVRSLVAAQLVGDQSPRLTLLALQQLAKKTFGSPAVTTRLDEDIEDVAILIDGTPEIVPPESRKFTGFLVRLSRAPPNTLALARVLTGAGCSRRGAPGGGRWALLIQEGDFQLISGRGCPVGALRIFSGADSNSSV